MVETITPVGYGGSKPKWLVGVAMMTLGAAAVAALFGAFLGLAGSAFGAPWGAVGLAAVAVVALAYFAREAFGMKVPVLQAKRQVPEWWRTFFSPNVAAVLYGAGLGIGFFTYLTHGTLVVVAALVVAIGDPWIGVLLMLPFALSRTLTVLVARNAGTGDAANRLVTRLAAIGRTSGIRIANALTLLALAATIAVAAWLAMGETTGRAAQLGAFAVAVTGMTFAWAGLTKLVGFARWRDALIGYGLPAGVRVVVAASVPIAEVAVAALVILGYGRLASAIALTLLLGFSAAILRARALHGDRLDCGCFGSRHDRDFRVMLLRNALLAGAALAGVVYGPSAGSSPPGVEVVPLLLSVAGLVLVGWVARVVSSALRGGRA